MSSRGGDVRPTAREKRCYLVVQETQLKHAVRHASVTRSTDDVYFEERPWERKAGLLG